MVKLVISLGSNSHDRQSQMDFAIRHLKSILKNVLVSSIYETPAINGKDAPYFNAVAFAETDLSIEETTALMKQWEQSCGRTSESKQQGIIPIDLDIVVWDNKIIKERDFIMPYFTKGYKQIVVSDKIEQTNS